MEILRPKYNFRDDKLYKFMVARQMNLVSYPSLRIWKEGGIFFLVFAR